MLLCCVRPAETLPTNRHCVIPPAPGRDPRVGGDTKTFDELLVYLELPAVTDRGIGPRIRVAACLRKPSR